MALSGSTNLNGNAGTLCRSALLKLGVINPTATISAAIMSIALDSLNNMLKHWQMQGVHLWTQHEGVLLLDYGVAKYSFSDRSLSGGSVGMVNADALISTTLSADAAASATTLSVDSTTGMAATNKLVMKLDSGERHVTTIVSVNSATGLTITDALPSAASDENEVFTYSTTVSQTNLFYPKQITNVRLKTSDTNERILSEYGRQDYLARNNKILTAPPFSYYIEDNLTNKAIYLFPTPNDVGDTVRFTYIKALDDIDALTDDVEFPVEWRRTIIFNLACEMALEFGKDDKLKTLTPFALKYLDDALGWDDESADVQLIPDMGPTPR